jgi:hypothetical protein
MPRGGPRTGAGRKPGATTKKTREIADKAVELGITPLEVMLGTMRELWMTAEKGEITVSGEGATAKILTPMDYRLMASEVANKAAPFVHPKLANVEAQISGPDGGPIESKTTVVNANDVKAIVDKLEGEY